MYAKMFLIRESLTSKENVDEIYDAMGQKDLAATILAILKLINERDTAQLTATVTSMTNLNKTETGSVFYRTMGNQEFGAEKFQSALLFYNQAVINAPQDTIARALAISNRSALLIKHRAYAACLRDLQTCFRLNCPPQVVDKLRRRHLEVNSHVAIEKFNASLQKKYADAALKIDFISHPQIPCASQDIKIIGPITPKIVAAKEIKAGTIVCCEKAYLSYTNKINLFLACHYCQKMALNLIPCNGCCSAMFCSESCKKTCYNEYHKYECQIMDALVELADFDMPHLMIKTVFKMRSRCESWQEIIAESKKLGIERMRTSSIEEIFDSDYLFSVLNIRDDKTFIHGSMFNGSILIAVLLTYLAKIPDFYPQNKVEQKEAIEAVARIMLFFYIYQAQTYISQTVTNLSEGRGYVYSQSNSGIFTFIGKIKHSCIPNLHAINNNNEVMLIAIQDIEPDEELTLAKSMHHPESVTKEEHSQFIATGNMCECAKCTVPGFENKPLSQAQRNYYKSLDLLNIQRLLQDNQIKPVIDKTLVAMNILKDVPESREYKQILNLFRKSVNLYEMVKSENYILDSS